MRILVAVPLMGLSPEMVEQRQATLRKLALPGTDVHFRLVGGPLSIESRFEETVAATAVVNGLLSEDCNDEWDAAIVWCAADPGVGAAREVVHFPVIGPGEAACTLAAFLSTQFITISAVEGDRILAEDLSRRCGFGSKVAGNYALSIPVLDMHKDEERTVAGAVDLIKRSGAGAAALLCLGFTGLGGEISERAGVPVIDPGQAALQMAELVVHGRHNFSSVSFPRPRKLPVGGGL